MKDFLNSWPFSLKEKKEILGLLEGVKTLCLSKSKASVFKALNKDKKRLVPLSLFQLGVLGKSERRLKSLIKEFDLRFKTWPSPKLKASDLMKKALKKQDISPCLRLAFDYQLEQPSLTKRELLDLSLEALKTRSKK